MVEQLRALAPQSIVLEATGGYERLVVARLAIAGGLSVFAAPIVLGAFADAIGIGLAFAIVIPMLLLALLVAWTASRTGN